MPNPRDEWRAERRARRLQLLDERIPPVHAHPGELHPDVAGWVKRLADGDHPNMALVGGTGTGKTWHAWHAARAALLAGWDGSTDVVTADVFRHRTAPRPGHDPFQALVLMGSCGLLILDDVGAYRGTDWWAESMYAVVGRRYDQQLPTVVTSNVADLRGELGDRVASRLSRDITVVVLDGPDRRRT